MSFIANYFSITFKQKIKSAVSISTHSFCCKSEQQIIRYKIEQQCYYVMTTLAVAAVGEPFMYASITIRQHRQHHGSSKASFNTNQEQLHERLNDFVLEMPCAIFFICHLPSPLYHVMYFCHFLLKHRC